MSGNYWWLLTFKCNFLVSIVDFGRKLKDLGVETWVIDIAPNLPYTLKGRNIRQVHSGDAIEGPIPITRKIGARQMNIQVGFTAKGERRLEIQDIARCKTTHVATDQEIAKNKKPWLKTWPTKRRQRLAKKKNDTVIANS